METVKTLKCVKVPYNPSEEVIRPLNAFMDMVNRCIQAGLENNVTSKFRLQNLVYHDLMKCGSKLKEYPNRQVECINCGYHENRDIIACLNLLKASDVSLRFGLKHP